MGGWVNRQVAPLFQWLGEQFETIALWIVDAFITVILFFVELVQDMLAWFYDLLADVMPEGMESAWSSLAPYFGVVRVWFPVEYLGVLLGILYGTQAVVLTFKFLLKTKQLANPLG